MEMMFKEGILGGEEFYRSSSYRSDNANHKTKETGKEKVVFKSQVKIFSPRSGNSLIHLAVNLEWIVCSGNSWRAQVCAALVFGPRTA